MSVNPNNLTLAKIKTIFPLITAFLLGLALPTSIALLNIVCLLIILSIILNYKIFTTTFVAALKHPICYLPLLMFTLLVISLYYSNNESANVMLLKYRKFLYILPLSSFFLINSNLRSMTVKGFLVANTLILILSLLASLNWFNVFNIRPENPTVFRLHITQNFFMSISCLFWLILAYKNKSHLRYIYLLLVIFGLYDVLFLVEGRIGYLTIFVALTIWLWLMLNNNQRITLVLATIFAIILIAIVPNKAKNRIIQGANEIHACILNIHNNEINTDVCNTSMGARTEFVYMALKKISTSPLVGHGVGSFTYYDKKANQIHVNPHNEYLMQTVQSGLIGLTLFLVWVFFMYRASFQLVGQEKALYISLITAYMTGNFFNSFILDNAEGFGFIVLAAILLTYQLQEKNLLPAKTAD